MLSTLKKPIVSSDKDWKKYSGICADCLTPEEKSDMEGPMLQRTAQRIASAGRSK